MTIYATPGGTVANTQPFQGTTPGNSVAGATLQLTNPGVGLFPPNSDNHSGDTVLAAVSRAAAPMNAQLTNALAGFGITTIGGRPNSIAERMAESGPVGSSSTIGANSGSFHPMSNSANGGGGLGAGGANDDLGANSGRSDTLTGAMPSLSIGVSTPPNFQG
jgi:hypothetical protein